MSAIRTYAETAAALGIKEDQVRRIELRAFGKLRRDGRLKEVAWQYGWRHYNLDQVQTTPTRE